MKTRTLSFVLSILLLFSLTGCSWNLTSKKKIIKLYRRNESTFIAAVGSGDLTSVKKLRGIREISTRGEGEDAEIEFYCGGTGLVPSSSYYGILYIEKADTVFLQLIDSSSEWFADGDGYRYKQADGDNDFYYEPLGNGFFYYEEHY